MTDTATPSPPASAEDAGQQRSWLEAEVDGKPVRFWIVAGLVIAAVTLGFGAWWIYGLDNRGMEPMAGATSGQRAGGEQMSGGMGGGMNVDAPRVPPVFAYYDGAEIAFIHTEVSDPVIAQVLEGMMGSPVPVVESLAAVPDEARGTVYVFTNGIVPQDTPAGPVGFQPDVFDSAPGDEDYTPLREIVQVTWTDEADAQLLTTAEEVQAAEAADRVELQDTGVVVNAPFLTWPGRQR